MDSAPQGTASPHRLVGREHELARLEEPLRVVRDGGSATIVVRGDPGVGKSALLEQLIASASQFQVVRAVGVEGEVDLPYAGLQQLCRSFTDAIDALPEPQRVALRIAFGLASGEPPERYIVGLAVLSLMSENAATQPLLCVVDDAQWLDGATTQALGFIGRRLGADSVGLVIGCREAVSDFGGFPELHVGALSPADARALLDSVLVGHVDEAVRERLLMEAHGNPLALIELPRSLTTADAASGVLPPAQTPLSGRIEESFSLRITALGEQTRQLLLLASAEPAGDPLLLHRAAAQLSLPMDAADAAEDAGLIEIRERTSFRHPLVRSAVYQSATKRERRLAHAALADVTDGLLDPDRKAWHRAQATSAPDEDVAEELERTAARAKSRGGLAAAGAFLERAALLTPSAVRRAERTVVAAEFMYDAGAYDTVEALLRSLDNAQLDERHAARAERLHAEVAWKRRSHGETAFRLLAAAEKLTRFDPMLAQEAQHDALVAAWFGDSDLFKAVASACSDSVAAESDPIRGLILRGWAHVAAQRADGRDPSAGDRLIRGAALALLEKPQLDESDLPLLEQTERAFLSYWDFDGWETLWRRGVQVARDRGSYRHLRRSLDRWASVRTVAGDFLAASSASAEAAAIAEAIGEEWEMSKEPTWPAAWQLLESEALALVDLTESRGHRLGVVHPFWDATRALIHNAAGRYEAALEAAQRACDGTRTRVFFWTLPDLIEAATRCGERDRAHVGMEHLVRIARIVSADWGLGLEARSAALVTDDPLLAEPLYREAIERLDRARVRTDLARAHLVYGEWLRRENRRTDAREQLRAADDLFHAMGTHLFADRVRRELSATGETARKRTDDRRDDLTPQETQIAQLASEGLTNPEIGAKLFLSPRTVEWHLHHVFAKLGIGSRRALRNALGSAETVQALP
jgi:DNA-binding CsgD family transcriptional regulator